MSTERARIEQWLCTPESDAPVPDFVERDLSQPFEIDLTEWAEVELSPDFTDRVLEQLDRLRREGPTPLHTGATLHLEALIGSVIATAARGGEPIGVCCVDLGDEHGRRFALALHEASPAQLDPASVTAEGAAPWWCRAVPLARLAPVIAAVLGAEMSAAAESMHAAGAVPVVVVADGAARVAAFERPTGAS